ncbi:MAG: hypothetical protein FD123_3556 [Bacteroidetes bacterium]|nr:MAG: hypothetical protein FD123_3556 [Bacteroidota bacterium]
MKRPFFRPLAFLSAAAIAFVFVSCGDGSGTDGDTATTTKDSTDKTNDSVEVKQYAQVPSPGEMFTFMKMVGTQNAKPDVLNPTDNQKKYESKKAQGLNFGIYSADLLYCSTFGLGPQALKYFATVKQMGDKLQVATSISEKDQERIKNNIGNSDSLAAISNDLYYSSFANLEKNERGADLSLMLAGGWTESLFLMTGLVKDFDKDNQAVIRIAEQKYSLDNLIEYMTVHESNDDVSAVLKQMTELKALFDQIQDPAANNGGMNSKSGKRVLGGKPKLTVTKELFEQIRTKITEIRNSHIGLQ